MIIFHILSIITYMYAYIYRQIFLISSYFIFYKKSNVQNYPFNYFFNSSHFSCIYEQRLYKKKKIKQIIQEKENIYYIYFL